MIAVIASRAFYDVPGLEVLDTEYVRTPFGDPSDGISTVRFGKSRSFKVLARNGGNGRILPDAMNYLANIWALHHLQVKHVIGISSVATLDESMPMGSILVPDQLIDYTQGRSASFIGKIENAPCVLSDFSDPFYAPLRHRLESWLTTIQTPLSMHTSGVYGCLSGPRRETKAEAIRYAKDGCHCLGFTVMPEAILSQELAMGYASLAFVTRAALPTQGENSLSAMQLDRQFNEALYHIFSAVTP